VDCGAAEAELIGRQNGGLGQCWGMTPERSYRRSGACGCRLEDPDRPVGAIDGHAAFERVEARPQYEDSAALELRERTSNAVTCCGDPPGAYLPMHVLRGTRPVGLGILGLEESRVARVFLCLGVAWVASLHALERARQQ
jgi:hypothetical protein